MHDRRGVAVLVVPAAVGDVVEVGVELVKLPLRNRVVLVVVTACTADRQPQPDGGSGLEAIDSVLDLVLVGIGAVFGIAAMIAVEARRDALGQTRIGQQVARELLHRELVEGHVFVEGLDHPIAPPPHVARTVVLVAIGVCVTSGFQPAERHPLSEARRGQQALDRCLVSLGRVVRQKSAHCVRGWRQAGQIERHSPQQFGPIRLGRRPQTLLLQARQHEAVNRVVSPFARCRCPGGWLDQGFESPMPRPLGTLADPLLQHGGLLRAERCVSKGLRRHAPGRIGGLEASDQLALVGLARHDRELAAGQGGEGALLGVQPQRGHARGGVGTVTGIAAVGQNRAHIPVKIHPVGGRWERCARDCNGNCD